MKLLKPIPKKPKARIKLDKGSASKQRQYNQKFKVLSEAIPYVELYNGQVVVIAIEDSIIANNDQLKLFAEDVVLLKRAGINPIIVHNAEHGLKNFFERMKITYETHNGQIIVNKRNIELVEMVCSASVNKAIVTAINDAEGMAIGISGKDGKLIEAKKSKIISRNKNNVDQIVDNTYAGDPIMINPSILAPFEESEIIPVISPIGYNEAVQAIYLESISIASCIASSIAASKLIVMSNHNLFIDEEGKVIEEMASNEAVKYIEKFDTHLARKLQMAISTVDYFSETVHFVNSNIMHGLVFEILSDERPGTLVFSTVAEL
ncbi:amino acid kinase family protein [Rickettsiales endosymbiont of Stachyamoeba lipophora]|uniref:amino acid kinase family protein n=1 Tax=Rickettsiales endosymbiont of Stachyamoeba lipophora TaxID=2486578 RepID=UPI000F64AEA4|nr:hypothetical protein [Rickettsiales endosymbiont of Stachyamoeba lipophora]AZL15732.1 hypothetical protein EF513_04120 [Rickettsiales endosymbiont of Stachyamoeba lipophora]